MQDHYRVFVDGWRVLRKHRDSPPRNDDEWKEAVKDADTFAHGCGETDFACDIYCAIINELRRLSG